MASDFMVLWLRVLASWAYLQAVIQISSSKVLLEPVKKSLISQLGYIWNHIYIYILGLGVGKQCRVEGGWQQVAVGAPAAAGEVAAAQQ